MTPRRITTPVLCICGHTSDLHQHHRDGTDCAYCTCPRVRLVRPVRNENAWCALYAALILTAIYCSLWAIELWSVTP